MAGQIIEDSSRHILFKKEYQSWMIFYIVLSTFFFLIAVYSKIPQQLLLDKKRETNHFAKNNKVITEIHNIKKTKSQLEKKFNVFLSDQNTRAKGKLTKKKGFRSNTRQFDLSIPKSGGQGSFQKRSSSQQKILKKKKKSKEGQFTVNLIALPSNRYSKGRKGSRSVFSGMNKKFSIPEDYKYRDKFIFSFDRYGNPMLPSMKFEYKYYFDRMTKKIGENWAPPGGNPFYGLNNGMQTSVPGRLTYQAFPEHIIKTAIMLDADGNVLDVKILASKNIQSLDMSILEAIIRSKNFGKVPVEILENNRLIIQIYFPINYRR